LVISRLKFAKYKTKADKKISALILDVITEGYALLQTKASYEIFDVEISKGTIKVIGESFIIKSRLLAKHLKGAKRIALFVCTIGSELPSKVNEYAVRGEIARATILDAVGSEAAEALAEKIDELIKAKAKQEGFSAVRRFSPGYGDWTLFDQAKILKILKAGRLGVRLTKGCIMVPEKSVTACIGLAQKSPRPIRKIYERHIK